MTKRCYHYPHIQSFSIPTSPIFLATHVITVMVNLKKPAVHISKSRRTGYPNSSVLSGHDVHGSGKMEGCKKSQDQGQEKRTGVESERQGSVELLESENQNLVQSKEIVHEGLKALVFMQTEKSIQM